MDIVLIHASMLSDLGSGSEDHAGVDFEKNVRSTFVMQGAVELVGHRLQRKDLLDSQRCLVCRRTQIGYHASGERGIFQPDERGII